jgi:hypothetical protein
MLGDLVGEELSAEDRVRVEEHLCRCPPCAAAATSYREVIELAARLPPLPVPPALWQRLRQTARDMGVELPPDIEGDAPADSNPRTDDPQAIPHREGESLGVRKKGGCEK